MLEVFGTRIDRIVAGIACWNAATGSWLRECGALETNAGVGVTVAGALLIMSIIFGLLLRIPREDEALLQYFGDNWVQFKKRVPYSLVPGLI
ncbi:Protein-S-isoprenylcysteine O-methyltransferase [Mycena indigotica]|uniref:Protein-S-isoprenylcysteine O-methyltransferase n=1 Tax=Mycena indigotica TaxID=2126181 RepID=A0A8H6TEL8_9AGAR|nr:Protein-S-isoprenylcysteine O-methyltransferase [Mycena indigotica]KAF7315352.1 Protein-S-isoprenylcysteine O-methyltransferase [Mycena indigotica]